MKEKIDNMVKLSVLWILGFLGIITFPFLKIFRIMSNRAEIFNIRSLFN